MTGLVRRATLFTAVGLMAAAAAYAGVPSAANSTLGTGIMLGGRVGANVDALVQKTMTVRDAANNPVPNSVVVINFTGCGSPNEIKISSTQPFAGMFVNCAARTVSAVTNASGIATFRVVGAAAATSAAFVGVGEGCASVTADGVALGTMSVGTPDLNGATGGGGALGVTGQDTLQYTNHLFGVGLYRSRANFTGAAGTINGQDTLVYTGFLFGGGSTTNGPYCAGM